MSIIGPKSTKDFTPEQMERINSIDKAIGIHMFDRQTYDTSTQIIQGVLKGLLENKEITEDERNLYTEYKLADELERAEKKTNRRRRCAIL